METKLHVFEKAGLGKAPYKYLGVETKRGPIKWSEGGVTHEVGSPGQPMGSCQYCGTGILYCFWLQSADGKRFYVGSECIHKSGDSGLRRDVSADVRKAERERRWALNKARNEELGKLLADPEVIRKLTQAPSPNAYNKNLLGWATWMFDHAGDAGRWRTLKAVRAALVAAPTP